MLSPPIATLTAIPPNPAIHTNEMSGGTINTHMINSRIVRPRDTRATKPPMNGDHEITHAQ